MIELRRVSRRFGAFWAVQGLNLSVEAGEIYGFLGPNGAGKSTSLRMMTGLLEPSEGEVRILGCGYATDGVTIKQNMGVVFDEPQLFPGLTGREYMEFVRAVFHCDKDDFLRRSVRVQDGLGIDFLDKKLGECSHGMKQKVAVLSVLARQPRVLFLDEPTVGLDARAVQHLKELLLDLSREGTAVVLTTHVMSIAEKLCSRIGIINKGRLVAEGTMESLRSRASPEGAADVSLESIFLALTEEKA